MEGTYRDHEVQLLTAMCVPPMPKQQNNSLQEGFTLHTLKYLKYSSILKLVRGLQVAKEPPHRLPTIRWIISQMASLQQSYQEAVHVPVH